MTVSTTSTQPVIQKKQEQEPKPMATEAEVMGDDMRRVHRSFADLLEDDRFAYVISGRILGFDPTCADYRVRISVRTDSALHSSSFRQDEDVPRYLPRSRRRRRRHRLVRPARAVGNDEEWNRVVSYHIRRAVHRPMLVKPSDAYIIPTIADSRAILLAFQVLQEPGATPVT